MSEVLEHMRDCFFVEAMSQKLACAVDVSEAACVLLSAVRESFNLDAVVLISDGIGLVPVVEGVRMGETDIQAASLAFLREEETGTGTDILPLAAFRFIPIRSPNGICGVLAVLPSDELLTPEICSVLGIFADLTGLSMGRLSPIA